MTARVTIVAVAVALIACTPRMIAPHCNFSDFEAAPYDHMIEQLPAVSVAELEGRLRLNPHHVGSGLWPDGLEARIELHGADGFREFIEAGHDGTFVRRGLRSGTYCFKLSANGFRSAMGTIVIDPAAQQHDPFEIELVIAE